MAMHLINERIILTVKIVMTLIHLCDDEDKKEKQPQSINCHKFAASPSSYRHNMYFSS
jgi:hypothetical protein